MKNNKQNENNEILDKSEFDEGNTSVHGRNYVQICFYKGERLQPRAKIMS